MVRATERSYKNIYVLQIGASLCYKLGQLYLIKNYGKRCYKLGKLHYYKLGKFLLQIRAAITNCGKKYHKLGQVLQIRAIMTNWGITDGRSRILREAICICLWSISRLGFNFILNILFPPGFSPYQSNSWHHFQPRTQILL